MIVMKFGGTSVEDAKAIDRVGGDRKGALAQQPVVVVSAMAKVTDTLLTMAQAAGAGERKTALKLCRSLQERHYNTAGELLGTGAVHANFKRTGAGFRGARRTAARHRRGRRNHSPHHRPRRRLRRNALQQDRGRSVLRARTEGVAWSTRASASSPTATHMRAVPHVRRNERAAEAEGSAVAR